MRKDEWKCPLEQPCGGCCCECKYAPKETEEEPILEKVKDVRLLCNASLWRENIRGEKYSVISVPTGNPWKKEEYKCLRKDEDELIKAYQALKTVQICEVYDDVDF